MRAERETQKALAVVFSEGLIVCRMTASA